MEITHGGQANKQKPDYTEEPRDPNKEGIVVTTTPPIPQEQTKSYYLQRPLNYKPPDTSLNNSDGIDDSITAIDTNAHQISLDSVRRDITFVADSANTGTVTIGKLNTPSFPLKAGASITVYRTKLSHYSYQSSSGADTFYYIGGGEIS